MKKRDFTIAFLLVFSFLIGFAYADIEIPIEFCGDGALQDYLGEQCDPGLIDFPLSEDSLFQLAHCNSPFDLMGCQCESTLSDGNGVCYFCGDRIYTPINPLNESCDGSEHCTFDCTCEFDYIGNEYGQCVKCWGDNLNGHTCQTEGFQYGTLLCDAAGNFDTSQCYDCPEGQIGDDNGNCICPSGTVPDTNNINNLNAQPASTNFFTNALNFVVSLFTNSDTTAVNNNANTNTVVCVPETPCNKTQNYTCWDKCQICINGNTGECGPNPNTLTNCEHFFCCINKNNTNPSLHNETCTGIDLKVFTAYSCKKTCVGDESRCGTSFCCNLTEGSGMQCKEFKLPSSRLAPTLAWVGYCQPKVCGPSKTPYDDKCNKVADGVGKHWLCCKSNEKCGLRKEKAFGNYLPSCIATSCPSGQEICHGWFSGREPAVQNNGLPPNPLTLPGVPRGTSTDGELAICCPKGTCTVSREGAPRCNPPTGSYSNPLPNSIN